MARPDDLQRLQQMRRQLDDRERLRQLRQQLDEREAQAAAPAPFVPPSAPTFAPPPAPAPTLTLPPPLDLPAVDKMTPVQREPDIAAARQRAYEKLYERYALTDAPNAGVEAQRDIARVEQGPVASMPAPTERPERSWYDRSPLAALEDFGPALRPRTTATDQRPMTLRARSLGASITQPETWPRRVAAWVAKDVVGETLAWGSKPGNPLADAFVSIAKDPGAAASSLMTPYGAKAEVEVGDRIALARQANAMKLIGSLMETRDAPITEYGLDAKLVDVLDAEQLKQRYPDIPARVIDRAYAARAALDAGYRGQAVPDDLLRRSGMLATDDGWAPPSTPETSESAVPYLFRVAGGAVMTPPAALAYGAANRFGLSNSADGMTGVAGLPTPRSYLRDPHEDDDAWAPWLNRSIRDVAQRMEAGRWVMNDAGEVGAAYARLAGGDERTQAGARTAGSSLGMAVEAIVPVDTILASGIGGAVRGVRNLRALRDVARAAKDLEASIPPDDPSVVDPSDPSVTDPTAATDPRSTVGSNGASSPRASTVGSNGASSPRASTVGSNGASTPSTPSTGGPSSVGSVSESRAVRDWLIRRIDDGEMEQWYRDGEPDDLFDRPVDTFTERPEDYAPEPTTEVGSRGPSTQTQVDPWAIGPRPPPPPWADYQFTWEEAAAYDLMSPADQRRFRRLAWEQAQWEAQADARRAAREAEQEAALAEDAAIRGQVQAVDDGPDAVWRDIRPPDGVEFSDPRILESYQQGMWRSLGRPDVLPESVRKPASAPEPALPPETQQMRADLDELIATAANSSEAEHLSGVRDLLDQGQDLERVAEQIEIARNRRADNAGSLRGASFWADLQKQLEVARDFERSQNLKTDQPLDPSAPPPPTPDPPSRSDADTPPPTDDDLGAVPLPEDLYLRPLAAEEGQRPAHLELVDRETGQTRLAFVRTEAEAAALRARGQRAQVLRRDNGEEYGKSEWRALVRTHTPYGATLAPSDMVTTEGAPYVAARPDGTYSVMDWQPTLQPDGTTSLRAVEVSRADTGPEAAAKLAQQRLHHRIRMPQPPQPPVKPTYGRGLPLPAAKEAPFYVPYETKRGYEVKYLDDSGTPRVRRFSGADRAAALDVAWDWIDRTRAAYTLDPWQVVEVRPKAQLPWTYSDDSGFFRRFFATEDVARSAMEIERGAAPVTDPTPAPPPAPVLPAADQPSVAPAVDPVAPPVADPPSRSDPGTTHWVRLGSDKDGMSAYYGINDADGKLVAGPFPESWLGERLQELVDAGLAPDEAMSAIKARLDDGAQQFMAGAQARHARDWTPDTLDQWRERFNASPLEQRNAPYGVFPTPTWEQPGKAPARLFSVRGPTGKGKHPRARWYPNPDAAASFAEILRKIDAMEAPASTPLPNGRPRIQNVSLPRDAAVPTPARPIDPTPRPQGSQTPAPAANRTGMAALRDWWQSRVKGRRALYERWREATSRRRYDWLRTGRQRRGAIGWPARTPPGPPKTPLGAVLRGREYDFMLDTGRRMAAAIEAGADPTQLPRNVLRRLDEVSHRRYGMSYADLARVDGLAYVPDPLHPDTAVINTATARTASELQARLGAGTPMADHAAWNSLQRYHHQLPEDAAYTLRNGDGTPVQDVAFASLEDAVNAALKRRDPGDMISRGDRPVVSWRGDPQTQWVLTADRLFSSPDELSVVNGLTRRYPSNNLRQPAISAANPGGPEWRPLAEAPGLQTRAGQVVVEAARSAGRDMLGTERLTTLDNGAVIPTALLSEYEQQVKALMPSRNVLRGGTIHPTDRAKLAAIDPKYNTAASFPTTAKGRAVEWRRLQDLVTRQVLGELGERVTRTVGSPGIRASVHAWLSDVAIKGKRARTGTSKRVADAVQKSFVRQILDGFTSDALARMPPPVKARLRQYETQQAGVLDAVVSDTSKVLGGLEVEQAQYYATARMAPVSVQALAQARRVMASVQAPPGLSAPLLSPSSVTGTRGWLPHYNVSAPRVNAAAVVRAQRTYRAAAQAASDWLHSNLMARGAGRHAFADEIRSLPANDLVNLYEEFAHQGDPNGPQLNALYERVTGQPMRPLEGGYSDALQAMHVLLHAEANLEALLGDLLNLNAAVRKGDPRVAALRDVLTNQHWRRDAAGNWTTDHAPDVLQWAESMLDRWGMTAGAWEGLPLELQTVPAGEVEALLPPHIVAEIKARTEAAAVSPSELLPGGPGRARSLREGYNTARRYNKAMLTYVLSPYYLLGQIISTPSYLINSRGLLGATRAIGEAQLPLVGELVSRTGGVASPSARVARRIATPEFLETRTGARYHIDELEAVIRESGIGEGRATYDQVHGLRRAILNADAVRNQPTFGLRNLRARASQVNTWLRDVANAADTNARVAVFVDEVRQGRPLREAADVARDATPDFNALTPFEQKYLRNVFTFYAFLRKNHDHWLRAFIFNPSRVLGQMRLVYSAWNNSDLTDREWWAMSSQDQGRAYFGVDETPSDGEGVADGRMKRTAIGTAPFGPGEWLGLYTLGAGLVAPGTGGNNPEEDVRNAQFMVDPMLSTAVQQLYPGDALERRSKNKVPSWLMTLPGLSDTARTAFDIAAYPLSPEDPPGLADPRATAENGGHPSYYVAGEGNASVLDEGTRYRARRAWQAFSQTMGGALMRGQELSTVAGLVEPPPYLTPNEFRQRWALGLRTRPVYVEREVERRARRETERRLNDVGDAAEVPPETR